MTNTEGRVVLAIQAYNKAQSRNLRAAARTYEATYSTVRRCISGVPSRRDSTPTNRKLTSVEEATLTQWILSMDERGMPLRSAAVRRMADILLGERLESADASTRFIGNRWVYNFIQRHLDLKSKYNRKYDY